MSEHSKRDQDAEIRRKIIGLGDDSLHKSYYPELQQRLGDLERFRALVDNSPDLVCIIHLPDGKIQETNRAMRDFFHGIGSNLYERSIYDVFPTDTHEVFRNTLNQGVQDEGGEDLVIHIENSNGQCIPYEFSIITRTWQNGAFATLIGRDISERLERENHIRRQMQRLDYLHQIDLSITNYNRIETTLDTVIEILKTELGIRAACFSILEQNTQALKELSYYGLDGFHYNHLGIVPHPFVDSRKIAHLRKRALSSNHPVLEAIHPQELNILKQAHLYIAMVLETQGKRKGLLEVYLFEENFPDENWLSFFQSLCTQSTIAIDHAQIVDNLRATNIELEKTYDTTLEGWALALELREKETSQHTYRVTDTTVSLSQKMGFSASELVHIRRGALLHDIGKMGIPDEILLKPGPLTPSEWVIMRKHPEYAYGMLYPIPFLRPAIDIPYAHHEKWDGSGYPRGLKGEDIPFSARLFTIIDVWDALSSDRPYRRAWTEEAVLEYILQQSGTAFEPDLVRFFMDFHANVHSGNKILAEP